MASKNFGGVLKEGTSNWNERGGVLGVGWVPGPQARDHPRCRVTSPPTDHTSAHTHRVCSTIQHDWRHFGGVIGESRTIDRVRSTRGTHAIDQRASNPTPSRSHPIGTYTRCNRYLMYRPTVHTGIRLSHETQRLIRECSAAAQVLASFQYGPRATVDTTLHEALSAFRHHVADAIRRKGGTWQLVIDELDQRRANRANGTHAPRPTPGAESSGIVEE